MKRQNRILTALIASCFACVVTASSYAQSPQAEKLIEPVSVYRIGDVRSSIDSYTASLAFDVKPAAGEITTGRARSLVGAVVGLISAVVGGLALARSAGRLDTGNGPAGGIAAVVLGLLGMILSIIHLSTFTGGFGTGSGRAGAIVALVLSLIGTSLGGLALARSRRLRSTD